LIDPYRTNAASNRNPLLQRPAELANTSGGKNYDSVPASANRQFNTIWDNYKQS
jgi:hypothetical protein